MWTWLWFIITKHDFFSQIKCLRHFSFDLLPLLRYIVNEANFSGKNWAAWRLISRALRGPQKMGHQQQKQTQIVVKARQIGLVFYFGSVGGRRALFQEMGVFIWGDDDVATSKMWTIQMHKILQNKCVASILLVGILLRVGLVMTKEQPSNLPLVINTWPFSNATIKGM